jgi:hypothetical protein
LFVDACICSDWVLFISFGLPVAFYSFHLEGGSTGEVAVVRWAGRLQNLFLLFLLLSLFLLFLASPSADRAGRRLVGLEFDMPAICDLPVQAVPGAAFLVRGGSVGGVLEAFCGGRLEAGPAVWK